MMNSVLFEITTIDGKPVVLFNDGDIVPIEGMLAEFMFHVEIGMNRLLPDKLEIREQEI